MKQAIPSAPLVASLLLHGSFLALLMNPVSSPREPETKITWVNLASGGSRGGAEALEKGRATQRVRQSEEVAAKNNFQKNAPRTPDPFAVRSKGLIAKGTGEQSSTGTAPNAPKGNSENKNLIRGTSGEGASGGIGEGSPLPGLSPSKSFTGGSGYVSGIEGDFPYAYYLQQVQGKITSNWTRSGETGRVGIYFRIMKDGSIDPARIKIESPSGSRYLDESARLAILRSGKFPALPDDYQALYLGIHFWFVYLGN